MKFVILVFFTLSINCYFIDNQFLRKLQSGIFLKYVTSTKCVDLKNTTLITIDTDYYPSEDNQLPIETYIEFPIYLTNDESTIRLNCTLKYLPILNCYPTDNATSSVDVVKYSVEPINGEFVLGNYRIRGEILIDAIHHKSGVVAPLQNGPIKFDYAKEDKDEFTFSIDFDGKVNKDAPPIVKANSQILKCFVKEKEENKLTCSFNKKDLPFKKDNLNTNDPNEDNQIEETIYPVSYADGCSGESLTGVYIHILSSNNSSSLITLNFVWFIIILLLI